MTHELASNRPFLLTPHHSYVLIPCKRLRIAKHEMKKVQSQVSRSSVFLSPSSNPDLRSIRWHQDLSNPPNIRSFSSVLLWKFNNIIQQDMRQNHLEFEIHQEASRTSVLAMTEREEMSTCRHETEVGRQGSRTGCFCLSVFVGTEEVVDDVFAELGVAEGNELVGELEDVVVGLVGE